MWNKTNKRKGNASTALEESINRIFFMGIEIMKRSAVMLYLTVVFSVFTIAQNTTSTLTGTTSDSDDILPGAVVKLTEVESGITYSAISNQKGQFRITGLTPGGPYRLEVSCRSQEERYRHQAHQPW